MSTGKSRGPVGVAEQLRRAIGDSGMSARGLALAAGVDASGVVRFLSGQRDLSFATAAKLCDYLGLRLVESARPTSRPRAAVKRPPPTRSGKTSPAGPK